MKVITKTDFLSMVFKNEDQFCAAVNMYVSHNYEFLRGMYFHIANERVNKFESMKAKSMGVLEGVPDFRFEKIFKGWITTKVPGYKNGPVQAVAEYCSGWYLELKLPNGKTSNAQRELHKRWFNNGIEIYLAFDQQQVCNVLEKKYGPPKFI